MAKDDWWIKFEIHKWLNDPKARRLTRANRDSWMTALCMMRLDGTDRLSGTQPDLSNMLGLSLTEFYDFYHDLERSGTADVTRCHAESQNCPEVFTIISRRFKRELSAKEKSRLRKQKERGHTDVTEMSRDRVKSKKKEVKNKKKEEVVAAIAANGSNPVETRIWTDGVDLLSRSGLKQSDARAFLGKQAKDFGRESLAEAIAVTQAKNPADPKPFLVAILQDRLGASEKAKACVGKSEEVEIEVQCKTCFDTGQVRQTPANPRWEWDVEYVPCPSDHHKERQAI